MNTTISITVSEAEVVQVFGEEIDVSKANDTQSVRVLPLDWSDELLKNVNGVVLGVLEAVFLCVNI